MPLAQFTSERRERRLAYNAHIGVESRAELYREKLTSRGGRSLFGYPGIANAVSSENLEELLVENALQIAKKYTFDQTTWRWAESLSEVRVRARDLPRADVLSPKGIAQEVVRAATRPVAWPHPLWVRQINQMATHELGQVTNTVKSVIEQLIDEGPKAIDASVRNIDFDRANDYHVVAAVRALKAHREKLETWPELVKKTRELLIRNGVKPDKALRGID